MEPLSPELETLISAADGIDGPDEETTSRLFNRLSVTLALPMALTVPAVAKTTAASIKMSSVLTLVKPKVIIVLLISGFGLIFFSVYRFADNGTAGTAGTPTTMNAPAEPDADAAVASVTPKENEGQTADNNVVESHTEKTEIDNVNKTAPDKPRVVASEKATAAYTLNDEQQLIESARRALNAKQPDTAIELLLKHRRIFKRGQFVEEREVLRIQALAQKGQFRAAERSAHRFLQNHPNTVFRDAVTAAVGVHH